MMRLEILENISRLDDYNTGRLEVMKVQYLEMLHTKFEVSKTNSVAMR